jgi:hypothetical protein
MVQALMSQIWVDGVAVATRCSQVSTHLGQDGVTLYWDEGQMEIIAEGICSAEDENQDSTNSSFIHKAPHYKLKEDDSQKSLVLSEDRPHDREMARCLTTLNSLPVCSTLLLSPTASVAWGVHFLWRDSR